ncbi:hypothetical protein [Streptomyces longwoodensis]|uniref:hypothetical protein n=1 Tax=Streptomyces longwoodensis TaxID=68231 RepID=UPI00225A1A07|nr:hypothetical protein [Streptomyces longwoodensis]MCX5000931.1 hypothetical protein [Streptomyces longwoodensis]
MATRTRKTAAKKNTAKNTTPTRKATAKQAPTHTRGVTLVKKPPLPVRRRLFTGPLGVTEQAAIRAALAAAAARLPIPVRSWNGSTAQLTDGTLLIHNPGPDRIFTAHIACPHGAIHGYPITTPTQLQDARGQTSACLQHHAPHTLSSNGLPYDWHKALSHGVRPRHRVDDGIALIRITTADTQTLSRDDITAGLQARAADTEQPKGHPEP